MRWGPCIYCKKEWWLPPQRVGRECTENGKLSRTELAEELPVRAALGGHPQF